jgi:3-methyl-2-oxobutanoate hydroxymethyltransferase
MKFYDGAVDKVTIPALQQMKRDGRKIVGVVAWDFQIAQIADRAGVEILSVGDSVGVNLWGHENPLEITLDEMIVVCKAVRRGTKRAILSCDLPFGPLQEGVDSALRASVRIVKEAGADMVKVDGAAEFPEIVKAIVRAGIPVFAQFGVENPAPMANFVIDAKRMEDAGASLIDFKYSGPVVGPAVAKAVSIPVLGGLGGGPWLDGRMRMAHAAIGYGASWLESKTETYANVARVTLDALTAYAEDVRAGRQIRGQSGVGSR